MGRKTAWYRGFCFRNQAQQNMEKNNFTEKALWGKFASIYNERIYDLKKPDGLTSKTIRKIINNSGNTYFDLKEQRNTELQILSEEERDRLIYTYQVCLGSGYWINVAEQILTFGEFSPISEDEEEKSDGNFKQWEILASELFSAFSKYIQEYEKKESEIPSDLSVGPLIRFVIFIKENGLKEIPIEYPVNPLSLQNPRYVLKFLYNGYAVAGQEVDSIENTIDRDLLHLTVWGYALGRIERKWRKL